MKTYVDSSTIIALSRIGELDLLKKLIGKVYITQSIEKELLRYKYPETDKIEKAIGDWIITVKVKGSRKQYTRYGLDEGEATLFLTDKKDRLIIDELNARRIADVEGREYIGLLGLIIAACETKKINKTKAKEILTKLAESDFRMTVGLYKTIINRIDML